MQGDIVGIVDSNGTEVVKYTYDAWGKPLGKTGTLASTLGTVQPFRYRGYVYDEETGLYYLRSRYYNPERQRFINADSLIQGNLFAYCCNSPIDSVDPDGNLTWPGEIHIAVQRDIKEKFEGLRLEAPFFVTDKNERKRGRADILDPQTGEIWEVKPAHLGLDFAYDQLKKYINGLIVPREGYKFDKVKEGRILVEGKQTFLYTSGDGSVYEVDYWFDLKGAVLYEYRLVDGMRDTVPIKVRKKQQQRNTNNLSSKLVFSSAILLLGFGVGLASRKSGGLGVEDAALSAY